MNLENLEKREDVATTTQIFNELKNHAEQHQYQDDTCRLCNDFDKIWEICFRYHNLKII